MKMIEPLDKVLVRAWWAGGKVKICTVYRVPSKPKNMYAVIDSNMPIGCQFYYITKDLILSFFKIAGKKFYR